MLLWECGQAGWCVVHGKTSVGTTPAVTIGRLGGQTLAECLCTGNPTAGRILRQRLKLDLPAVARGLHTLRRRNLMNGNRRLKSANNEGTRAFIFGSQFGTTVNISVHSGDLGLYTVSLRNNIVTQRRATLPCHGASTCCRGVNNVVGSFTRGVRHNNASILKITFTVRNVISTSKAAVDFNDVVNGANIGLNAVTRGIRCPDVVVRSSSTSTVTRL